jgi:betaine-homocysteine S-methyltransferase
MFEEQIGWAVEADVDYVIGETFTWLGEALIALDAIRGAGKLAVITLAVPRSDTMWDGSDPEDACAALEAHGASVVGLNCFRGPRTMENMVTRIRRRVSCHVAALPVPYRTSTAEPTFQALTDPGCDCVPDNRPFPTALDPLRCNRYEMAEFAENAYALGIRYLGGCCGTGPHDIRAMAERLGRRPPAARYSPDMTKHAYFGTDANGNHIDL